MDPLDRLADSLKQRFPALRPLLVPGMIRFARFGIVGVSGIAVNMAVLLLSMRVLMHDWSSTVALPLIGRTVEWRLVVGTIAAIVLSIFSNFLINNAWTWRDRSATAGHFMVRMAKYYMAASVGAAINWSTTIVLSGLLDSGLYLLWNLIGIALAMVSNFLINHFWTYRVSAEPPQGAATPDLVAADADQTRAIP